MNLDLFDINVGKYTLNNVHITTKLANEIKTNLDIRSPSTI